MLRDLSIKFEKKKGGRVQQKEKGKGGPRHERVKGWLRK
jgi:hypothetical protein